MLVSTAWAGIKVGVKLELLAQAPAEGVGIGHLPACLLELGPARHAD